MRTNNAARRAPAERQYLNMKLNRLLGMDITDSREGIQSAVSAFTRSNNRPKSNPPLLEIIIIRFSVGR